MHVTVDYRILVLHKFVRNLVIADEVIRKVLAFLGYSFLEVLPIIAFAFFG
jgi:hypothetical protein